MNKKEAIAQAKKELRDKLRDKRVSAWIVKDCGDTAVTVTAYSPNRGSPTITKKFD